MKTSGTRNVIRWAAVGCAAVAATVALVGQSAARADDTAPTAKPAGRDVKAIIADLQKSMQKAAAVTGPDTMGDATKRSAAAEKAVPALKKLVGYCDELSAASKQWAVQAAPVKQDAVTKLYAFGDKPTVTKVDAMADGEDKVEQVKGKTVQLQARWTTAGSDEAAQSEVADAVEKLDGEHPDSIPLTLFTNQIAHTAKSADVKARLAKVVTDTMKNPAATAMREQAEGAAKLAALSGKPLDIAGKTVDDKDFTSADYKGKVVLVDFWATWCGPCKAELPRVKDLYAKYHDKGLEIVGVSNDQSVGALTKYVAENDMPWVELLDKKAAAQGKWNPLTFGYGIYGIPVMFLIDKKGVCRTVEARSQMEEMIPKLLAE